MLTVSALAAEIGAARALRGVALGVGSGALVALLGGNGAGKTTLLRAIAGLHRPVRGSIQFRGAELSRLGPERILRRGVALVSQQPNPPPAMTVHEALGLGALAGRGQAAALRERVYGLFPRLEAVAGAPCARLDHEGARFFAIARALTTRPRLLLLDEPTAGLSEEATETVLTALEALHGAGLGILLAEQNAAAALALCDYGYVLHRGAVVAQGRPSDLRATRAAMEAFLG